MAQDLDRQRALLNTVINLTLPKTARKHFEKQICEEDIEEEEEVLLHTGFDRLLLNPYVHIISNHLPVSFDTK
jgi:hypothetical protein